MAADQSASQPTQEERIQRAKERVSEIKGFYIHFAIFVVVLSVLFIVDATTSGGWWVQWVFLGWGIGVLAHAAAIFGSTPNFVRRWEEHKVRQYLDES